MNSPALLRRRAAFLLLETMIGVAIFAIGVLALARCVSQCLDAESAKVWDERARVALANRMAEIEAGAVSLEKNKPEELEGLFKGITLNQTRTPLHLKDEAEKELPGLFQVDLEAVWKEPAGPQSKALTFYVYQPK